MAVTITPLAHQFHVETNIFHVIDALEIIINIADN
jgi:hypothetical protein